MTRPTIRELLTEGADTQHTVCLTWQEAQALLAHCAHDCDPADPEMRRLDSAHFLDCPVLSFLGAIAPSAKGGV